MVDGELCPRPTREALVQAGSRTCSASSRIVHNSRWLRSFRGWIVQLFRQNILRAPIWAAADQNQDRRYSQVSLQRRDGTDGRQRSIGYNVWQASLRIVHRPDVRGDTAGRFVQPRKEDD